MTEMQKLVAGYQRFHDNYFQKDQENLYAQLSLGQTPSVCVIACSDSRVDPAIVMDCKPGDLFVVRNVANLVPPYEQGGGYHGVSAALEYSVGVLKVQHLVVLGHKHCGGIKALVEGMPVGSKTEFIEPWVNIAKRAGDKVKYTLPNASKEAQLCACELESIAVSLENLATFPFVKEALDNQTIELHGWYFDIENGEMQAFDAESKTFKALI